MNGDAFLQLWQPITIVYLMLMLALFFSFGRLVRGPSLPDRVVALDLIGIQTAGIITVYTIDTGQRVFLDAAIVLGLIVFLGTIAFARYLERRGQDE
jgi:multicomponent Na+:H+ antiporter subunit F